MRVKCADCGMFYEGTSCGSCERIIASLPAVSGGAGRAREPSGDDRIGGARFVGDAAPIAGIPLSRVFNAACYIIAGIASLLVSGQPSMPKVWLVLIGLAALSYGVKILATRSSYWVNSLVYIVALFAVLGAASVLAG